MERSRHGIAPGYVCPGDGLMRKKVAASSSKARTSAARAQNRRRPDRFEASPAEAIGLVGSVLSVRPP